MTLAFHLSVMSPSDRPTPSIPAGPRKSKPRRKNQGLAQDQFGPVLTLALALPFLLAIGVVVYDARGQIQENYSASGTRYCRS
jgi:hypothetical protein